MLTVKTVKKEQVAIVEVNGEVDLYSSPQVRNAILELIENKSPLLIVNMSNVGYIDSSGVATLVEGLQQIKKYNGRFVLVDLGVEVKSVFELSRLDKVFEIYDSIEEALKNII
jgi:anti-sigma B factor antagonist